MNDKDWKTQSTQPNQKFVGEEFGNGIGNLCDRIAMAGQYELEKEGRKEKAPDQEIGTIRDDSHSPYRQNGQTTQQWKRCGLPIGLRCLFFLIGIVVAIQHGESAHGRTHENFGHVEDGMKALAVKDGEGGMPQPTRRLAERLLVHLGNLRQCEWHDGHGKGQTGKEPGGSIPNFGVHRHPGLGQREGQESVDGGRRPALDHDIGVEKHGAEQQQYEPMHGIEGHNLAQPPFLGGCIGQFGRGGSLSDLGAGVGRDVARNGKEGTDSDVDLGKEL
eukprot:scaffold1184_cov132-Cylindrotheca_fusiformis.AAC.97